jgi:FkbM family methyltransferase
MTMTKTTGDPRVRMGDFAEFGHHTLLLRELRPGIRVLDLGAHRGGFSRALAASYPGEYHAVEPNPELVAALQKDPLFASVTPAAVLDRTGPIELHLAAYDVHSSILELPADDLFVEVGRTTVDGIALSELVASIPGRIDVLKADIEGAEVYALPALSRTDLSRIGQLTVEFHGSPLFGFGIRRNVRRTIWGLRHKGFVAVSFSGVERDVLFLNRRLSRISRREQVRWQIAAALARWAAHARWRSRRWLDQRSWPGRLERLKVTARRWRRSRIARPHSSRR